MDSRALGCSHCQVGAVIEQASSAGIQNTAQLERPGSSKMARLNQAESHVWELSR